MNKIAKTLTALGITATMVLPMAALAQQGTLNSNDLGVGNIAGTIKLGGNDVQTTAANIINVALGFLGIIAVIIVLVGGCKYMIAGGDETKTKDARGWIISGIIGLAIILAGWAITSFVIGQLIEATTA
ncbi:MAG: pilin [Patescibacteria group bacterium]